MTSRDWRSWRRTGHHFPETIVALTSKIHCPSAEIWAESIDPGRVTITLLLPVTVTVL